MTEYIRPGVYVTGYGTVHPPGWMWTLGFALGGCEWAIRKAGTEEFRNMVRQWHRNQDCIRLKIHITDLEKQLTAAHVALQELKDNEPCPE